MASTKLTAAAYPKLHAALTAALGYTGLPVSPSVVFNVEGVSAARLARLETNPAKAAPWVAMVASTSVLWSFKGNVPATGYTGVVRMSGVRPS
jgi:hypothetical protein